MPVEHSGFRLIGREGGAESDVAALDFNLYRDMRWCANCGGERVFLEVFRFAGGRVGCCLGCGEERVIAFSRTNSERA